MSTLRNVLIKEIKYAFLAFFFSTFIVSDNSAYSWLLTSFEAELVH